MDERIFQRQIKELRSVNGDLARQRGLAETLVSRAVVDLLQHDRLYGEVLLQVPRRYDERQTAIMGLKWKKNQLNLVINPGLLAKLQLSDELPNLLRHEVLHVVWQHPLRYQQHSHQHNVGIATDVAVNQYLKSAPAGTMTLAQLQPLIKEQLPAKQDSERYLSIIENGQLQHDDQQQAKQTTQLDRTVEARRNKHGVGDNSSVNADTHDGWQSDDPQQNVSQQVANLKQLLTKAWAKTPDKQRGLLPGDVSQQLEQVDEEPRLNWRQLLKKSLGTMPLGKRDSHARFNRRQPVRMDLPGQITNLVVNVAVFVDNSGSMGEFEIAYLLNQIRSIMKVYEAKLTVYSFDTQVHDRDAYEVHQGNQIKFRRIGGGGTRFQSVFDFLHANHATNNDTLAIVLTDGWGEQTIEQFHFTNVLWVLTTDRQELSVKSVNLRVVSLMDDPSFKKLKERN